MNSNDNSSRSDHPAGRSGVNRAVAAGLTLGVLGGTAAGLVFGVPGLTSAASSDVVVTPPAVVQQVDDTDPAVPADEAPAEMGTRLRDTLQALVDDGTITAEQADAVTAHLIEHRPERPERPNRGEGREGRGGGGMFGRGVTSEALTDLLDIDAQDLREQLRDGATLAEIAAAQGVEPRAVVDELVAELTERLDNAEARITDMVNNGRD